ncbi:MAG TPA: SDR family oxidoreductase [Patescibacteria group bacterium]
MDTYRFPSGGVPRQQQDWPGHESSLTPLADHGETSYVGSGKLVGKKALITGGDSGIGRAVALAFAREGADVAIVYFNELNDAKRTVEIITEAGQKGYMYEGDVSEYSVCRNLVKQAVNDLGGLDILVNNAAYQQEQPSFLNITPEQLERTFKTNIFGYIWMAQAVLPSFASGGVIINTGSVTAMEGSSSLIDYASTKGAIHAFTKSLAKAVSSQGIRVNCVAPGPVWTPLIPSTLLPDHVEKFGSDTLWKRPAMPAELAPTYVFLASEESSYYTGKVFDPTGN